MTFLVVACCIPNAACVWVTAILARSVAQSNFSFLSFCFGFQTLIQFSLEIDKIAYLTIFIVIKDYKKGKKNVRTNR